MAVQMVAVLVHFQFRALTYMCAFYTDQLWVGWRAGWRVGGCVNAFTARAACGQTSLKRVIVEKR